METSPAPQTPPVGGSPARLQDENASEEEMLARRIGKALSPGGRRQSPRIAAASTRSPLSPSRASSPAAGKKSVTATPSTPAPPASASASARRTGGLGSALLQHMRASPMVRTMSERALTPLRRAVSLVMFSPVALSASGSKRTRALPSAHTPSKLSRTPSKRSTTESTMRLWRSQADPALVATLSKQELKRQELIFELISTEEEYVADLTMVAEVFEAGMRAIPSVQQDDIDVIFGALDQIIQANGTLLAALHERQAQSEQVHAIGEVLSSNIPVLGEYTEYCGNMRRASSRLRMLMQNDDVNAFLQECSYTPECRRLGLADFLDMPRRRLLKYAMLIKDIAGNTPADHVDSAEIAAALARFTEVTHAIDAEAGRIESQHRLLEIVEAMCSTKKLAAKDRERLEAARTVVFEGPLHLATPATHVIGILLDNVFLLVREKDKNNAVAYRSVKDSIPASELHVVDMAEMQVETVYADLKYAMRIGGKDGSFVVAAPSAKLRHEWITHIKSVAAEPRST